jgi:hypothetical protein
MSKSILCTIDFSASSRQALVWAIDIAQELHMHLTILYTYRLLHAPGSNVVQLKKKLEEEALQKFSDLEREILLGRDITYDFRTEVGFVADRVEDHTRHHPISFLVMDKNMSTANRETFEDLFEHIHVPVVIVPEA